MSMRPCKLLCPVVMVLCATPAGHAASTEAGEWADARPGSIMTQSTIGGAEGHPKPLPDEELKRLKRAASDTLTLDIKEFNGYDGRPVSDGPINASNVEPFLQENIPLFICSDEDFTEVYNYRWWMISKHLKDYKDSKSSKDYWVFTEFFDIKGWGPTEHAAK